MWYNNRQIIFDGNSLTNIDASLNTFKYYLPIKLFYDLRTAGKIFAGQHYGISGKRTSQLIADFPTKIAPFLRKGDIVILWEITNDVGQAIGSQQAYNNLVTYSGLVRDKGAKIVVVNFIARDSVGDYVNLNADGFGVNALLAADTTNFDGKVDVGSLPQFDAKSDCANTTYYNADKVHLTNTGYDLISAQIQTVIQSMI